LVKNPGRIGRVYIPGLPVALFGTLRLRSGQVLKACPFKASLRSDFVSTMRHECLWPLRYQDAAATAGTTL